MGSGNINVIAAQAQREVALDDLANIMRAHQPRVLRFVMLSIQDQDAAESITQDCFFKAYARRDQFRGECSVRTWLMRIAFNMVRSHARNQRLRFWKAAAVSSVPIASISDLLKTDQSSPEAQMLAKERIAIMHRALAELSTRQRTVFLMRFIEDLEVSEIAQITEMQLSTVKTHLQRAVGAIRARVGAS
ncbi:MAG TPA: sigma-70 family RNA polymerase sigma factor [Verrucomicrobiae bacterium]|nr:sigma-70 family RNA polymerase sigma factor [Verrucomicrobiae bacterium]